MAAGLLLEGQLGIAAAGLSVSFRLHDLIKLEVLFGSGGVMSGVGNSDNL